MLRNPKGQRVGVFVDVQNMYYSARFMYNSKVNFKALFQDAIRGRTHIRAIAYVIRSEETNKEAFFGALENFGFEIKSKDVQVFYGGAKKGDWDIGIAMDAIELAPKLDTIVLISGDGDFVPLVQHLQRALGCRVEVMAFGKSASGKLIEAADEFTDLDKNLRKYLIGKEERRPRESRELDTHTVGGNPEPVQRPSSKSTLGGK